MATDVTENLRELSAKLKQLISNYKAIQKENADLKQALLTTKEKHKELVEKVETLDQQILIIKASTTKMEGEEKRLFEKKIDQYIKDIEKTISVLSE